MLAPSAKQQLQDWGFLIFPTLIPPAQVARLNERIEELFALEGDSAGSEFKTEPGARRIANAVDKGQIFEEAIENPEVLAAIEIVPGPDFKLSSLNIRSANPRNGCAQPLHVDGGELPDNIGNSVCNSVWMLDDFTEHNGSLRIVPGSHQWGRAPEPGATLKSRRNAGHRESGRRCRQVNAHLWHGGSENLTDHQRGVRCTSITPAATSPSSNIRSAWCGRKSRRGCESAARAADFSGAR